VAGAPGSTVVRVSGGTVVPFSSGEGLVAPDGSFQFTNLAPGTYQVTITPAGPTIPRLSVTLVDKDVTDFQLVVPFRVNVPGTVTVEGGGPIPRFQLTFSDAVPRTAVQGTAPGLAGPTNIAVNPTFSGPLPSGDQVVNVVGLVPGYTLKSITSGGVDLARNPLRVTPDVAPIQIVLGIASPSPFVRIAGRVVGRAEWHLLTNFLVSLPQIAGAPEVIFYLDGSFEFPMTLPGDHQVRVSDSSASMVPSVVAAGQANTVIHVPTTPVSRDALSAAGTEGLAVRVSGRIVGRARASKGAKVRLHNPATGETLTGPAFMDGSFEFARVMPGTYTAEIYPAVPGAEPTPIPVGDSDMKDVRITVPDTGEFRGRVQMENNALMPRTLTFSFAAGNSVSTTLRPDGSFQVELPLGRRVQLAANSIPQGSALASMTLGTVDLRNNPLPSPESTAAELRVALRLTASAAVSGRVGGTGPLPSGAVVWLTDSSGVYHTLETTVAPDRTFAFPTVAPGNYTARLSAPGTPARATVTPVVVSGAGVTGIEILP
jgi:hypothetical protein